MSCRTLSEDSTLGLRRILSQSTDSLSFRNRAMSIESLNDDGTRNYTSSHQNDKSNVSAIGQVSKLVLSKQEGSLPESQKCSREWKLQFVLGRISRV